MLMCLQSIHLISYKGMPPVHWQLTSHLHCSIQVQNKLNSEWRRVFVGTYAEFYACAITQFTAEQCAVMRAPDQLKTLLGVA